MRDRGARITLLHLRPDGRIGALAADETRPGDAWFVHFGDGSVNFDTKTDFNFVRAVRGGL
jgi:hypothetical protein